MKKIFKDREGYAIPYHSDFHIYIYPLALGSARAWDCHMSCHNSIIDIFVRKKIIDMGYDKEFNTDSRLRALHSARSFFNEIRHN